MAARELHEKAGIRDVYLEQLYTFSEPARDPGARCISVAHLALIRGDVQLQTTDKYSGIGWFPVARLPPLAFDHEAIAEYAVKRLRTKLEYSDVARNLLDKTYTVRGFYFGDEPPDFDNKLYVQLGEPRNGGVHFTARY